MGTGTGQTVAVVVGGNTVDPAIASQLGDVDYVIAADSGLHAAQRLGLTTDLLVGDLDSVDHEMLDGLAARIERHPRAKDQTDIVLALDRASDARADRVIVVSGGGGRLDHALANLLVLASPRYAHVEIRAHVGSARVDVVRSRVEMTGDPGTLVSLFAVGGPASGVTTDGLRFPLRDAVLEPLSSRGVSNELIGGPASVAVADGTLLAIRPGPEHPPAPSEPASTTSAGSNP